MVDVIFNAKKEDYIKALKEDNLAMFAMNQRLTERIKEYKKEMDELLQSPFAEDRQKRLYYVVTLIQALYYTIRRNLHEIKVNLDKVRGLRDGTIKEI